jgi:hypothetical protein
MKRALLLGCAVALALAVAAPAAAQKLADERTFFTFSEPVELPGMTLPAGKYMFRIADTNSGKKIVQIFDESGMTIHATLLSIDARRMEPTEEATVEFLETAANQPRAIRVWWYPGDLTGHEFVYPKEQAIRLARASTATVLTTETGTDTETMRTAELSRVDASGTLTAEGRASTTTQTAETRTETETTTARAEMETRETVGTSGAQETEATATTSTRRSLPKTASPLELFGLIGLLSCAAAASVRVFSSVRR